MITLRSPGMDPSLKEGLGAIPYSKNPREGIKPSLLCFMHIVPPVIMIKTLDSGVDAISDEGSMVVGVCSWSFIKSKVPASPHSPRFFSPTAEQGTCQCFVCYLIL